MIITILCTFEMSTDIFIGTKRFSISTHKNVPLFNSLLQSKRHSFIPIPIVFKRTDFRHSDALCFKGMFTLHV